MLIVTAWVVKPSAGAVMASVGAVVSDGGWRVTLMEVSVALPAWSMAWTASELFPTTSETLARLQSDPGLIVAATPFTVTCATPDAYWPGSATVPLTVMDSDCVLEPSVGELIVKIGAVVSVGGWRTTAIVCGGLAFPALSVARTTRELFPTVSGTLMVKVPSAGLIVAATSLIVTCATPEGY